MIIARTFVKAAAKMPKNRIIITQTYNFVKFDSNIITADTLKKFQAFMHENTEQSLTQAAQMMAELEVKVETIDYQIEQMEKQLQKCPSHTKSLIQRIQKVLDNIQLQDEQIFGIQKRAEKQINDCKSFSITNAAKETLDVADSIKRCHNHALQIYKNEDHAEVKVFKSALTQIHAIFQVHGIKQFDPLGLSYDPNMQQAMVQVPLQEGKQPNTVAFTSRTGYTIKGRLLRSAHVGVYQ